MTVTMMRQTLALGLMLLVLSPQAAQACRPFGSYQFVEDADGGVWFTEGDNNAISRLAPDGTVRAHPLPTPHSEPSSLALDPSGNIWFVAMDTAKIGRLGLDGRIVEYATTDGHPSLVAVDRAGEAWFTQMAGNEDGGSHAGHEGHGIAKIGRIDGKGQMHSYPTPEGWPTSVAFDGQDRAWVTLLVPGVGGAPPRGHLARLGRDGNWTLAGSRVGSCPGNMIRLPDGGLAYSDHCRGVLGRVSAKGEISAQDLPAGTYIQQMSATADGTLWFTGDGKSRLGRIDRRGRLTYLERPENGDQTMAVLATRNGDVVFSEFYNYNINRLTREGTYIEHLINVDERQGMREVRTGEVCYIQFAARIVSKKEMDAKRAEEVRSGRFRPDGKGTEKLVEEKCLVCHDARRLLLSRRSDWTPSITRMHAYRDVRNVEPLTEEETIRLVGYFNEYYGLR
jgi:virginiamycin B lyase